MSEVPEPKSHSGWTVAILLAIGVVSILVVAAVVTPPAAPAPTATPSQDLVAVQFQNDVQQLSTCTTVHWSLIADCLNTFSSEVEGLSVPVSAGSGQFQLELVAASLASYYTGLDLGTRTCSEVINESAIFMGDLSSFSSAVGASNLSVPNVGSCP